MKKDYCTFKLCQVQPDKLTGSARSQTPMKATLFREDSQVQLRGLEDGMYSTRLSWKQDHPTLTSNKCLALVQQKNTARKFERIQKIKEYHTLMKQQLEQGV